MKRGVGLLVCSYVGSLFELSITRVKSHFLGMFTYYLIIIGTSVYLLSTASIRFQ